MPSEVSTRSDEDQLGKDLNGRTMCGAGGSERWQEFHSGGAEGGPLIEFKRGPGHPVEPTQQVGTWSTSGSRVIHSYTGGPSYSWLVCRTGSATTPLTLVGPFENVIVTLVDGQVACP